MEDILKRKMIEYEIINNEKINKAHINKRKYLQFQLGGVSFLIYHFSDANFMYDLDYFTTTKYM